MRLWPRSLIGQMMLTVALALLLAQTIGAVIAYRALAERREAALIHNAAFRFLSTIRDDADRHGEPRDADQRGRGRRDEAGRGPGPRGFRLEHSAASPMRSGEVRDLEAESELRRILSEQDFAAADVIVLRRDVSRDAVAQRRIARQFKLFPPHRDEALPTRVLIAGVRRSDGGDWLIARVFVPAGEGTALMMQLVQTLLIYVVLVGAIALILRRITRPLAALTERLERFGETRSIDGQLTPEGPDDVRRLIVAHNAMEARIAALLDEKDVMLGAIGHDLKTPLAALRVRIESVEDEAERSKMAHTIEDIVRTLDDILSLARVGRPSDPREPSELSALVAAVVEEYEDMGEPVTLTEDMPRLVVSLRATWLRRALRNLIGNALRYGHSAQVSLRRDDGRAVIRIDDEGPGIPDAEIAEMLDPFTRGERSRNTETGGAGLGLALARAIAEQHGGTLRLSNRRRADGTVAGLTAELALPAG